VLTHGFLIDVDGRKMSKSVGNVIAPQEVIKESGAETLRLWVAMSDFREELRVGKQILQRVTEAYRKIRNTMRFLVSNLYDFDPTADSVPLERMQEVDRYALDRYAAAASSSVKAYGRYDYPSIFQTLNQFVTVDLSAFYADVSKDRLYTFGAASADRRSAQTAMFVMADGLARLLAPILPVTADELWRHLPGPREQSVHLADFPRELDTLSDASLAARWEQLLSTRNEVNRVLETARQAKTIGTSLGAHVSLRAGGNTARLLADYERDLPMLFIVSQVSLDAAGSDGLQVIVTRAEGDKCERCWRVLPSLSGAPDAPGLCSRCVSALAQAPQGAS
jgi:isoleucyl-tRNA synthetase